MLCAGIRHALWRSKGHTLLIQWVSTRLIGLRGLALVRIVEGVRRGWTGVTIEVGQELHREGIRCNFS